MLVASLAAGPTAAATPDDSGMPDDVASESVPALTHAASSALGSAAGSSARASRTRVARTRTARAKPDRPEQPGDGAEGNQERIVAAGSTPTAAPATSAAEGSGDPLRILFIGNSHTRRYGGMDWLVGNLVASEDPPHGIDAELITESGVTLEYHFLHEALPAIRDGDWDVVVLQEYVPGLPARSAEPFSMYAKLLDKAIRESGARTVLYMTWPDAANPWAGLDEIVAAYQRVSGEIGAPVAPVGVAMERATAERPDLEFLGPDEVHTTWEGAYLAAATIYATIFGKSPQGLPYHFGISEDDAAFLQRIAWETARDWQAEAGHPFAESGAPVAGDGAVALDDQATASEAQPTG